MKSVSIRQPSKVLIVSYGGIGDILLTTPLISSLKAAYPNAIIHAYVQKNRESILEGNPDISAVYTNRFRHGIRSYMDFALKFFRNYDLAISTRTSDRQVLFARWAGRKAISLITPGGKGLFWKKCLLSGWAASDGNQHVVFDIIQLAEALKIDPCSRCQAPYDPNSSRRLTKHLPFRWRSEKYAVLHPFPRNRYKQWTRSGWKIVAEFLVMRGVHVVLTGGTDKEETSYVASLAEEMPDGVIDLSGALSLADLAELLRHSAMYIGPDTATTHLAAIVETPTIALYGARGNRQRYMPYHSAIESTRTEQIADGVQRNGHVYIVHGECDCDAGSTLPACEREPQKLGACMKRLRPSIVVTQIDDILLRTSLPCCGVESRAR